MDKKWYKKLIRIKMRWWCEQRWRRQPPPSTFDTKQRSFFCLRSDERHSKAVESKQNRISLYFERGRVVFAFLVFLVMLIRTVRNSLSISCHVLLPPKDSSQVNYYSSCSCCCCCYCDLLQSPQAAINSQRTSCSHQNPNPNSTPK